MDLVLSTDKGLVQDVKVECPVANSYHNITRFTVSLVAEWGKKDKRVIYNYHNANYSVICTSLQTGVWNNSGETNDRWDFLKNKLLDCRTEHVPVKQPKRGKYHG